MPENNIEVFWTRQAERNSIKIIEYLEKEFTAREVLNFHLMLKQFEKVVSIFPSIYPASGDVPNVRRAVLNKYLSVFYRANENRIEVLAVLDNRCDLSNWI